MTSRLGTGNKLNLFHSVIPDPPGLVYSVGASEGEAGQPQAGQLHLQHTQSKPYKSSTGTPYCIYSLTGFLLSTVRWRHRFSFTPMGGTIKNHIVLTGLMQFISMSSAQHLLSFSHVTPLSWTTPPSLSSMANFHIHNTGEVW